MSLREKDDLRLWLICFFTHKGFVYQCVKLYSRNRKGSKDVSELICDGRL